MPRFSNALAALVAIFLAIGMAAANGEEGHQHKGHEGMSDGIGTLTAMDREKKLVTITRDPVPAIDRPEATLEFHVDEHVDLKAFKVGQKVQYTVEEEKGHGHHIVVMCATGKDEVVEGLCGNEGHHGHHSDGNDH